jgi:hypothetical protein
MRQQIKNRFHGLLTQIGFRAVAGTSSLDEQDAK